MLRIGNNKTDIRGNNRRNTVMESRWAIGILNTLPKSAKKLWITTVKNADRIHGWEAKSIPDDNAPVAEWVQYIVHNPRKLHVWDKQQSEYDKQELKQHTILRNQSFFVNRGRTDAPLPLSRERSNSACNHAAGIVEYSYTPEELRDVFPTPQEHVKSLLIPDRNNPTSTAVLLQNQDAPFISGASGTAEACIIDFHRGISDGRKYDRKDAETQILILAAVLITSGHHSLSEVILVAKFYGYFENVTDPRVDYKKFISGIKAVCEKNELHHENLETSSFRRNTTRAVLLGASLSILAVKALFANTSEAPSILSQPPRLI